MNKSLYFKDEAWMKYHKCPECGKYVINPPTEIKYARADNRNRRRLCWNSALRILSKKTGWSPCYKCTAKYAKLLYYGWDFNKPIYTDCCGIPRRHPTAFRTGLIVGGDI